MSSRLALTLLAWMTVLSPALFARRACADYVTLRSGGEIRGVLLPETNTRAGRDRVAIQTLSGARVEIVKQEAEEVVRRRPVVEEYETRRRAAPDTRDAQWALSEWCRQQGLAKERRVHLARVIEFDPEHVLAHRGLGHIRDKGRWTTRDELFAERGYVKHKGKHVLPQELDVLSKQAFATQAEKRWYSQVKQSLGLLASDREDRSSSGLKKLRSIDRADAVPALAKALRTTPEEEYRLILVEVLSKIEGERPVVPLAMQSVLDESAAVRASAIRSVRKRPSDRVLPVYLRYLKDPLNLLVNRAAAALAELGEQAAVPHLIEALITRHQFQALLSEDEMDALLEEQTGPVIVLPIDYDPQVHRTAPDREHAVDDEMTEMRVEKDERNPSVLAALNLLTHQDFGYDRPAWRAWHTARANSGGASPRPIKPKAQHAAAADGSSPP